MHARASYRFLRRTKSGKTGPLAGRTCNFSAKMALVYNTLRKVDDPWPPMCSAAPVRHDERKISMATFDAVRAVRIALTVERFDQAVQFYRDLSWLLATSVQKKADLASPIALFPGHGTRWRNKGNLFFSLDGQRETPSGKNTGAFLAA